MELGRVFAYEVNAAALMRHADYAPDLSEAGLGAELLARGEAAEAAAQTG